MIEKIIEYMTNYFSMFMKKINLFFNYYQLKAFLEKNTWNKMKILYDNKEAIHQILYDNEKTIKIESNFNENDLDKYFYLSLLIKDNPNIIYYIYEIDLIINLAKYQNNNKNKNSYQNILLAMIILILIDNYRNTECFMESDDEVLDEIYEENMKIKNNEKDLKSLNINLESENIEDNEVSKFMMEIVESLVLNKKIENFEFCDNVLAQIGFEKINLTEDMYNKLIEIFEQNEEYVNGFKISQLNDLFNEKKLNFYTLISKYILKESIYIYNFPFFLSTRKNILRIVKSQSDKLISYDKNTEIKNKLFNILTFFCDSEYYIKKYLSAPKNELNEVLEYYKNFCFESKKEAIKRIENESLNKEEINLILKSDLEKAKKINLRKNLIFFLLNKNNNIKIVKLSEKKIESIVKKVENCEKLIKDNKFMNKMRTDDKEIFYEFFNQEKNKEMLLKIFTQEEYDCFMNGIKEEKIKKKEKNNNKDNTENSLLSIIEKLQLNEEKNSTSDTDNEIKEMVPNIKIIGKYESPAESIIQLNNGGYVSMGQKSLNVYDENYECNDIINYNSNHNLYTSIQEIKGMEEEETRIIASTNKDITIVKIDNKNKNKKNKKIKSEAYNIYNLTPKSCLAIDDRTNIICCKEGVYQIQDLFSDIISIKSKKICGDNCIRSFQIHQNLIAITSNSILSQGKDVIKFYNPKTESIIKELEGFSFINSANGITLMNNDENKNILICACKQYNQGQKNGILLIDVDNIEKEEIKYKFYDTNNFEVYSFCSLYLKNDENIEMPTIYFLVGGYNKEAKRGEIKLYKRKNFDNMEIEFVSNIENEKIENDEFKGFNGAISCIIQSKDDNNILITCTDGYVFLFQENFDFLQKENLIIF